MEGVLWKWTNYWNGWQPRWFVLDDGVLAYYKSRDEVDQGCKGSIRVGACELTVGQADPLRMDLRIPGEQQFYLRASEAHERQQWLVALGSAKACFDITNGGTDLTGKSAEARPVSPNSEERDALKVKRSELRLYCDLLMQQVHAVKDAADRQPGPDIEKMDTSTLLLSATCDTFIATLEDCLRLAKAQLHCPYPSLIDTPFIGTEPNGAHHNSDINDSQSVASVSPVHSSSGSRRTSRSSKKTSTSSLNERKNP